MRLRITNAIEKIAKVRFEKMLKVGYFPKVNYKSGNGGYSYNMIEYATTWATFMKVLDKRMIEKNFDPLGVFTRKHSELFLAKVRELAEEITEADVFVQSDRFHTMFD